MDAGAVNEAQAPGRHLEQGEGRVGSLIWWPKPTAEGVGAGAGRPRTTSPRFALAIPAWVLFICCSSRSRSLFIVYYSFGYKPDIFHGLRSRRTSCRSTATAKSFSGDVPRGLQAARCRSRSSARSCAC